MILGVMLRIIIITFWFLHIVVFWFTGGYTYSPDPYPDEAVLVSQECGLFGSMPYYTLRFVPESYVEIHWPFLIFGIVYSIILTAIFYLAWIGTGLLRDESSA